MTVPLRVRLAYPGPPHLGLENLGLQAIARVLQSHRHVVWDIACLEGDKAVYFQGDSPLKGSPHGLFNTPDLVGVSVSYEEDYFGLAPLLRALGVPPWADHRSDHHPLLLMGGLAPTINPRPLLPLADMLLLGEAEEALPFLLDALAPYPRRDALKDLPPIPGLVLPALGRDHGRATVSHLDQHSPERLMPYTKGEMAGLFLLEVSRGCPGTCKFCVARRLYAPYRARSLDGLAESLHRGLSQQKRIGLLGSAVTDHPDLAALLETIIQRQGTFSFSSLRATSLTKDILSAMERAGPRSVALAPETGSEDLRRQAGKVLTDDELEWAVAGCAEAGAQQIKLYFLVGLPGEDEGDLAAIGSLVSRLDRAAHDARKDRRKPVRITVSLNPFVPKPHTPWESVPPLSEAEMRRRLRQATASLRGQKGIRLSQGSPRSAQVQAMFDHGGPELAELIVEGRKTMR